MLSDCNNLGYFKYLRVFMMEISQSVEDYFKEILSINENSVKNIIFKEKKKTERM